MAGTVSGALSASRIRTAPDRPLALVAAGVEQQLAGAVLGVPDLEFDLFESAAALADVVPSLVVLCVEGALAPAIASDFEPLRRAAGQAPIVIVCSEMRAGELRLALAAGAAGVVLEAEVASALATCVEAARAGQVCVPRQHSQQIEPAALSPREKQILGLVVMGHTNAQIAEQLFLAESTVKSHLSSVFVKLGVKSRNEAVDLILDPERGIGFGILALGGEPIDMEPNRAR